MTAATDGGIGVLTGAAQWNVEDLTPVLVFCPECWEREFGAGKLRRDSLHSR